MRMLYFYRLHITEDMETGVYPAPLIGRYRPIRSKKRRLIKKWCKKMMAKPVLTTPSP